MNRENKEKRKGLWNICLAAGFAAALTVCCTMNAKAAVVTKPTNLHQVAASDSTITYTWDNGTTDSGKQYTYISEVSRSKDFSKANRIYTGSDCFNNEVLASGDMTNSMSDGTDYYVRVGLIDTTMGTSGYNQSDIQWTNAVKMSTTPLVQGSWIPKVTDASETSLTLSWGKIAKATGYEVTYRALGSLTTKTKYVKGTSVKLTGLKPETSYALSVAPYRGDGSFKAVGTPRQTDSYTLGKVSDFTVDNVSNGFYGFSWDEVFGVNEYELQITSYTDKNFKHPLYKKSANMIGHYVSSKKLSAGKFYLARVRAVKKITDKKKVKGSWTTITCGAVCKKVNAKKSGKNIQINWTKVAGATGYNVYVSTEYDQGYKKVATVNAKTLKYTLKKFNKKALNKKKTYYIRIEPVRKVNKTTWRTFPYGILASDISV